MSILKRILTWGKSETNAMIDKIEDPVKMTEQGIIDLKKDLENSLKSLAEVKAEAIRARRESDEKKQLASDYEKKAMLLLTKAQKGELKSEDADRLAGEALGKKEGFMKEALTLSQQQNNYEQMVSKLEEDIKKLKQQIDSWSTELTTLKARAKIANASKKLNQQLSQIDSSSTITMLEKMKNRVAEQEALAESYAHLATNHTSVDDEINRALQGEGRPAESDALKELKSKMGIAPKN